MPFILVARNKRVQDKTGDADPQMENSFTKIRTMFKIVTESGDVSN